MDYDYEEITDPVYGAQRAIQRAQATQFANTYRAAQKRASARWLAGVPGATRGTGLWATHCANCSEPRRTQHRPAHLGRQLHITASTWRLADRRAA